MLIKTKSSNKFIDMDKIYLNDFSYQHIAENLNLLMSKYSLEDVLDYLITRLNVQSPDLTIIKYIYPVFMLPHEFLDKNINKVVSNLNDKVIEFMFEYFDKEKMENLITKYLAYKLDNIKFSDIPSLIALFDKIEYPTWKSSNKKLSEMYLETMKKNEIQEALVNALIEISRNKQDLTVDKQERDIIYDLLRYLNNIPFEKMQKYIYSLIVDDYHQFLHRSAIQEICKKGFLNTNILTWVITYINEGGKQSSFIYENMKKYLFVDLEANKHINIDSFIKLAKSFGIVEWATMLKTFEDLHFDIEEQQQKYVSHITKSIEKWENLYILAEYGNIDYYVSLLVKENKCGDFVKRITTHLLSYPYRMWAISLNQRLKWVKSRKSDQYYAKCYLSNRILNGLLPLYTVNQDIQNLVYYIIENPQNHILLKEAYQVVPKEDKIKYEDIAKRGIIEIIESEEFMVTTTIPNTEEETEIIRKFAAERAFLLVPFLTVQNNEEFLNELLKFKNGMIVDEKLKTQIFAESVTKAIANSILV